MIPRFDLAELDAQEPVALARLAEAAQAVGFLTVHGTGLNAARVERLLAAYRAFFAQPEAVKAEVDMARTGANRGWGGPRSERVDPGSNADFKEVFDCGLELPPGDPWRARGLSVYAPNIWPSAPAGFRDEVEGYFNDAMQVAMRLLRAIASAMGGPPDAFDAAFARPMALLRGNGYPARPDWAGARDFGIGPHTDYGCLTLLATDGRPGLDVQLPDGGWQAVAAPPGEFIVNFGEMLEMWTAGRLRATPHRVIGGAQARISAPLFFNPSYDADVSPPGSAEPIAAGPHLARRYAETYVHLGGGGT